ncbi:MAG: tRNA uridine-5-carboxymethylaminomethyl(34) synthesis GTPase MnmE, partial [Acutalibacteraceae bacterium]
MQDTIYALSTPQGTGGVAVIRISGPQAEQALQALFVPMGAKELTPRVLQYGRFMHSGQEIDDGMAVFFRGPHSYTGENSVEFQCHGSLAVVDQLFDALSTLPDFRPAEPGEFTKRAFLNGKMDLSQAEAVMEVIA